MAKVAVIIVNYNTASLALKAVESLRTHTHGGHDVDIHLLDNASPEGDAKTFAREALARGWGGQVKLYAEKTNHGFGRGNNVVLRAVCTEPQPPEFVFLLNPDALLKNETIAILLNFLQQHPRVALVGARAYNPGDPKPVTAAFRFPSLASVFAAAINFGPVSRLFERYKVAIGSDLETQKVDWVSGAAVLARREILEDLGFFDSSYFLYYEEVDLMLRIARSGWQCWHVAEAEVFHVEGASTDVRSAHQERRRRPSYWYHSWRYYFQKNHGWAYTMAAACAWNAGAALNLVLARLRGQRSQTPLYFFRDFRAMVFRPLLGLPPRPYD